MPREKDQPLAGRGLADEMTGTIRASGALGADQVRSDRQKLPGPDSRRGRLWRRGYQKPKNAKPKEPNPESIHQYSVYFWLPGIAPDLVDANHLGSLHLGLPRMVELVDVHYPYAECIRVVQNNLPTDSAGALYETFAPAEARRILRRIEFHYTPRTPAGSIWSRSRSACCAAILTGQIDVKHWHDMIANPTVADAILDRLVHNAHRLSLTGESLRKSATKRPALDARTPA